MNTRFLEKLQLLLTKTGRPVPIWLEDLLCHGPRWEHWEPFEMRPDRMILTEFLARWLKYVGLSEEEALEWLMPYCMEILKPYSKSGPSAIRHGTKANTRWVYRSPFPFDFDAIYLEVAGKTVPGQPLYKPVFERWHELLYVAKEDARKNYVPPIIPIFVPVKKRFQEQFQKALEFARQKKSEGMRLEQITELLNNQGYLTRTGRKWTATTLHVSLRKSPFAKDENPEGPTRSQSVLPTPAPDPQTSPVESEPHPNAGKGT